MYGGARGSPFRGFSVVRSRLVFSHAAPVPRLVCARRPAGPGPAECRIPRPAGRQTLHLQSLPVGASSATGWEGAPQQVAAGGVGAAALAPGRVPAPWPGQHQPTVDGWNTTGSAPVHPGASAKTAEPFRRPARRRSPIGQRVTQREQRWGRSRTATQLTGKAGDGRPGRRVTPISWGGSRAALIKGLANAWRLPITPVLTRR
jgi:hypothetical protein